MKTRSEYVYGGGFKDKCYAFVSAIALTVGSQLGTGIVSAVSVAAGQAGFLISVCFLMTGDTADHSGDYEYCQFKFERCKASNKWPYNQCEQCYRYCMAQGHWNC